MQRVTAAATATAPLAPSSAEPSYRLPLALAYVFAPVLAVAAGAGVFELTESEGTAIAAGALMFALPAAVHVQHGGPLRGFVKLGSMLAVTSLGAAALGSVGYLIGSASCDRDDPYYEAEGCDIPTMAITGIGAATGAILGYAGYAAYDVAHGARTRTAHPVQDKGELALRIWLEPAVRTASQPERSGPFSGLKWGASLQF